MLQHQEQITLETLSDWLCPDEKERKSRVLKALPDFISVAQLAHPLLTGVDHNVRMPFHYHGKEKGTTIPLLLYVGLKLKVMAETGVSHENEHNLKALSKQTRRVIRQLMIDIYAVKAPQGQCIDVSKTLQAKIFANIVYSESLAIHGVDDVYLKSLTPRHAAHQVSGTSTPSITVQHFLCVWLLRRAHLHSETSLNAINSTLRQVAKLVCKTMSVEPMSFWEQDCGFSRRVQNAVMMAALSESFVQPIGQIMVANPCLWRI